MEVKLSDCNIYMKSFDIRATVIHARTVVSEKNPESTSYVCNVYQNGKSSSLSIRVMGTTERNIGIPKTLGTYLFKGVKAEPSDTRGMVLILIIKEELSDNSYELCESEETLEGMYESYAAPTPSSICESTPIYSDLKGVVESIKGPTPIKSGANFITTITIRDENSSMEVIKYHGDRDAHLGIKVGRKALIIGAKIERARSVETVELGEGKGNIRIGQFFKGVTFKDTPFIDLEVSSDFIDSPSTNISHPVVGINSNDTPFISESVKSIESLCRVKTLHVEKVFLTLEDVEPIDMRGPYSGWCRSCRQDLLMGSESDHSSCSDCKISQYPWMEVDLRDRGLYKSMTFRCGSDVLSCLGYNDFSYLKELVDEKGTGFLMDALSELGKRLEVKVKMNRWISSREPQEGRQRTSLIFFEVRSFDGKDQ